MLFKDDWNMQACRNLDPSSAGGDGDHVGVAGDFDVVARVVNVDFHWG